MKRYIRVFTPWRANLERLHRVESRIHVVETPSSRGKVETNMDGRPVAGIKEYLEEK